MDELNLFYMSNKEETYYRAHNNWNFIIDLSLVNITKHSQRTRNCTDLYIKKTIIKDF